MVLPPCTPDDHVIWVRFDGGQVLLHLPGTSTTADLRRSVLNVFRAKAKSGKFYDMTIPKKVDDIVLGVPTSEGWEEFEILENKDEDGKAITLDQALDNLKKGTTKPAIDGVAAKPAGYLADKGVKSNMFKVSIPIHQEDGA